MLNLTLKQRMDIIENFFSKRLDRVYLQIHGSDEIIHISITFGRLDRTLCIGTTDKGIEWSVSKNALEGEFPDIHSKYIVRFDSIDNNVSYQEILMILDHLPQLFAFYIKQKFFREDNCNTWEDRYNFCQKMQMYCQSYVRGQDKGDRKSVV